MNLYDFSKEFSELFDRLDSYDEYDAETYDALSEAWFTTLSEMEEDFSERAENLACYIKNCKATISAIGEEMKSLRERKTALERKVERLNSYLMLCMDETHTSKVEGARARISLRNNAESVLITDEQSFIDWATANGRDDLLKYEAPTIRKTAVKDAIKNGEDVPNAEMQRTRSVIIK